MSEPSEPTRWRQHGVRVVHAADLDPRTPQTPGMTRAMAIDRARAGANKLWAASPSTPTRGPAPITTARWRASSTW